METKYFFRIENDTFGFVVSGIHIILDTDIAITNEDYNKFFALQEQGKQFKLKSNVSGIGLFDYIEEFMPETININQELGIEDYLLDLEYRISKVELGV